MARARQRGADSGCSRFGVVGAGEAGPVKRMAARRQSVTRLEVSSRESGSATNRRFDHSRGCVCARSREFNESCYARVMMRSMVILVGCLLAGTESTGGNQWPNCEPSVEPMWFASPAEGAVVTSPVVVEVDATYQCYCDDGACFPWPIMQVEVWVDEIPGSTITGPIGAFEFELEPGTHTFEARPVEWEIADPITITVIADDPEPTGSGGDSSTGWARAARLARTSTSSGPIDVVGAGEAEPQQSSHQFDIAPRSTTCVNPACSSAVRAFLVRLPERQ